MSINSALVSVIIPAYNHEKYVQDTIESIINQTYQNIELIVIDDGSKDSTWQKIQEMKERCEHRFSRVVFETKQNEGTCKTLNKLLSLIEGDYVYIIASDDIAKSDAIETELSFLEKNSDYALCVGNNQIIDSNGRICYWKDKNKNIIYEKNKGVYSDFIDFVKSGKDIDFYGNNFGSYGSLFYANYIPNGYLIRKSILKNFKFTPKAPLEDYYLMLHISKYAKMKFINKILFSYRWHESNTSKRKEYMENITNQTREYEIKNNKKICLKDCLPSVVEFINNNYEYLYKSFGISHVLVLEKYKNQYGKIRKLRLFNKVLIKWKK